MTYLATSLKLAKFSVTERTACVTSEKMGQVAKAETENKVVDIHRAKMSNCKRAMYKNNLDEVDNYDLFFSFRFNGYFSRWTWVSRYQNVSILDFIGDKDDGGGGDSWSYKSCKAPVKSSSPTNQHPVLFTGRMCNLSPY